MKEALTKEVENKSELLLEKQEVIEEKDKEIEKLRNELRTERDLLADARNTIEEKDELIKLFNKPLSKTTSKFKIFKSNMKIKFHRLAEKVKHRSQELVARIEVRNK
jgi:archaellum component FlaC